jgi:hypothetical protein
MEQVGVKGRGKFRSRHIMTEVPQHLQDTETGTLLRYRLENAAQDDAAVADAGGKIGILLADLLKGLLFHIKSEIDEQAAQFFDTSGTVYNLKNQRVGFSQILCRKNCGIHELTPEKQGKAGLHWLRPGPPGEENQNNKGGRKRPA